MAHSADSLGKVLCTAIIQVIAINRGNNHMAEPQFCNRISHAPRFKNIKCIRAPGRNVAKRTTTGTDFPHDHHCCVPLAPTLTDIWATRLFTDSNQLIVAHNIPRFFITFTDGGFYADPIRLARLCIIGAMRLFGMAFLGDIQITHFNLPIAVRGSFNILLTKRKEIRSEIRYVIIA
jgi:hypothetical protein